MMLSTSLQRHCVAKRGAIGQAAPFAGSRLVSSSGSRTVSRQAERREIEPAPFADIYMAMAERLAAPGAVLPKGDGRVLVRHAQPRTSREQNPGSGHRGGVPEWGVRCGEGEGGTVGAHRVSHTRMCAICAKWLCQF